jgi:hypothetical protein
MPQGRLLARQALCQGCGSHAAGAMPLTAIAGWRALRGHKPNQGCGAGAGLRRAGGGGVDRPAPRLRARSLRQRAADGAHAAAGPRRRAALLVAVHRQGVACGGPSSPHSPPLPLPASLACCISLTAAWPAAGGMRCRQAPALSSLPRSDVTAQMSGFVLRHALALHSCQGDCWCGRQRGWCILRGACLGQGLTPCACAWAQGGREGRDIDAVELARAVQELGAGEILLNCIDMDGRCAGPSSGPCPSAAAAASCCLAASHTPALYRAEML